MQKGCAWIRRSPFVVQPLTRSIVICKQPAEVPERHGQKALRPTNPLKIVMNTIFMSNQNDQLWM